MKAEKSAVATEINFIGVDDGRFGIKVVTGDGKELYVPSRVSSGAQVMSIAGDDDSMYLTEEGNTYTVSENLSAIDTRFADYDHSDIVRVLVNHALIKAGYAGKQVKIVTGMPVGAYFNGMSVNDDLIERKRGNLLKKKATNRNPNIKSPEILNVSVAPEAIAAFFDLLIDMNGEVNASIEKMAAAGPIGIVDIGGETTDTAVIINAGKAIDNARSGTAKIGTLSLAEAVKLRLQQKFNIDAINPAKLEQAVSSGQFALYGTQHDVNDLLGEEKTVLAAQIIEEMKRKLRDASDLEAVFFVGGGALLLKEQIKNQFQHAQIVDGAQFSNARGMYKIAKFVKKD